MKSYYLTFNKLPIQVSVALLRRNGLSMGILGRIANKTFIADRLQQIFNFRRQRVIELFGTYPEISK